MMRIILAILWSLVFRALLSGLCTEAPVCGAEPESSAKQKLARTDKGRPDSPAIRLGSLEFRHGSYISSLAFGSQGKWLASADFDGAIRLWDVTNGNEIAHFTPGSGSINHIAFDAQGQKLLSIGKDNKVRLWDPLAGKQLNVFSGDDKVAGERGCFGRRIGVAVFSPDGKSIASAIDKVIRIWDLSTGKQLHCLSHEATVLYLAFKPDGRSLISASTDGTITTWDIPSGKRSASEKFPGTFSEFCMSPDGTKFAASSGHGYVRILKGATPQQTHWLNVANGPITSLCFSPDSRLLIATSIYAGVNCLDSNTGQVMNKLAAYHSRDPAVTFSSDGKIVALGGDSICRLWDLTSDKEINASEDHRGPIKYLAFTLDSRLLVSAGTDNTIRVWDWRKRKTLAKFGQETRHILSLALAPDGHELAVGHLDRFIRIWSLPEARKIIEFRAHDAGVKALCYTPDGKSLVSGSMDATIRLWDAGSGLQIRQVGEKISALLEMVLGQDGKTLAFDRAGIGLGMSNLETGRSWKPMILEDEHSPIGGMEVKGPHDHFCLACSPCENIVLLGVQAKRWANVEEEKSIYKPIRLCELESGQERFQFGVLNDRIDCMSCSPDGRVVAVANMIGQVQIWEMATGGRRFEFKPEQGLCLSLAFSPDGRWLATGGQDTTILIRDVSREPVSQDLAWPQNGELLWNELANPNASKAFQAMSILEAKPNQGIFLIKEKSKSAKAQYSSRIKELIADLDSNDFAVRKTAASELAEFGDYAVSALENTKAATRDPEVRRAIERIVSKQTRWPRLTKTLQMSRAMEVLEHIGNQKALEALQAMVQELPKGQLIDEAKASVERLTKRLAYLRTHPEQN